MRHQRQISEEEVRRTLADLEQRVRQRRRLLGDAASASAQDDDRRYLTDHWFVSAHLPITWSLPVAGRALALAKRAVRLLLRWYINPIVDQQNDFNAAVARAFVRTAAQQDALARALDDLEGRIAALEGRAPAREGEAPATERGGS